jgi:hypothetical protein
MIEVIKTSREVDVDENDLIGVDEAAKLSNRSISAIAAMLERGTLPWYQLPKFGGRMERKRIQRFTSRKAVEALPKEKTRGVATKRAKK